MRDTNSTHYYKVKFNEAVENYRKIILEVLSDSYKSDLKSLENLRSYTKSLNSFAENMTRLVDLHSETRFNHFRQMCRNGDSAICMPEVVYEIESLPEDAEVYVLVFSEDNSLMGTLTYDDVNF